MTRRKNEQNDNNNTEEVANPGRRSFLGATATVGALG